MLTTRIKMTYHDYAMLPDDQRYELIDGELLMTPAPTTPHQRASGNLFSLLREYITKSDLGEVFFAPLDVLLSDHDVVQPDLLFISKERMNIIGEKNIQGPPDLAVEVVSPTHRERDYFVKKDLYARYGVREYWLLDLQKRCIEVFKLAESKYELVGIFSESDTLSTPLLPNLNLTVSAVFRGL
ncbi:Uma2 family endonuclease [bacterium]|nr:Uma2 family endonuclease [bacterium]MCI0604688.1 Uma2 family endonuclease [bacterium]